MKGEMTLNKVDLSLIIPLISVHKRDLMVWSSIPVATTALLLGVTRVLYSVDPEYVEGLLTYPFIDGPPAIIFFLVHLLMLLSGYIAMAALASQLDSPMLRSMMHRAGALSFRPTIIAAILGIAVIISMGLATVLVAIILPMSAQRTLLFWGAHVWALVTGTIMTHLLHQLSGITREYCAFMVFVLNYVAVLIPFAPMRYLSAFYPLYAYIQRSYAWPHSLVWLLFIGVYISIIHRSQRTHDFLGG